MFNHTRQLLLHCAQQFTKVPWKSWAHPGCPLCCQPPPKTIVVLSCPPCLGSQVSGLSGLRLERSGQWPLLQQTPPCELAHGARKSRASLKKGLYRYYRCPLRAFRGGVEHLFDFKMMTCTSTTPPRLHPKKDETSCSRPPSRQHPSQSFGLTTPYRRGSTGVFQKREGVPRPSFCLPPRSSDVHPLRRLASSGL